MRRLLAFALCMTMFSPLPATAQDGVFRDYADMRSQLDMLMKSRRVDELLVLFGGSDEMTQQQLSNLKARVLAVYQQDFAHVDLIKSNEMGAGFRQELLTYYNTTDYMYVYILMHDRGDHLVSINFRFNSDFHEMNKDF